MKKILYAVNNFPTLIRDNGYYVDKTRYIELLEDFGPRYLMFLRPRRFGKSLFISMLETYYDVNRADEFDELFGGLHIGEKPTKLRNSFPILKFDFSDVATGGSLEETEKDFNKRVWSRINGFFVKYSDRFNLENVMDSQITPLENASSMLSRFIDYMEENNVSFYLLIDEYDNFANVILAGHGKKTYYDLTHGTGFLRNFFKAIKAGTNANTVARMFVTGVSPLVMSDVTSGFNIDENISQVNKFNEMVGFTQQETEAAVDYYIAHKLIPAVDRSRVLEVMKDYYDGYLFASNTENSVYNSTSVLYFLTQYVTTEEFPMEIIDKHMKTDYEKLQFLVVESQKINGNFKLLNEVLEKNEIRAGLVRNFAVDDLIKQDNFINFMYYLGFLTLSGKEMLSYMFSVPNKMCRVILWEYIKRTLEKVYELDFRQLRTQTEIMAYRGGWEEFLRYVLNEFYKNTSIRDSIYGEAGVKGFLLAYLGIGGVYTVRSEAELNKGYADIYLLPDLAAYPDMLPDHYLIELKYVKQADIKSSNKEKVVAKHLEQAKAQLEQYAGDSLIPKNTKKIVVITTSDELLALQEV
jgi:hypothetical protein